MPMLQFEQRRYLGVTLLLLKIKVFILTTLMVYLNDLDI